MLLTALAQGKALTSVCRVVHAEFTAAADKLSRAEYNALDLKNEEFAADSAAFKALLRQLDRRVAAAILQVRRIAAPDG